MVSVSRLSRTLFHAGFVCNFLSSSARLNLCSCFLWLTLAFYFRFWLLWALHSTVLPASFRLSDPRCFRFLSSASVLGSDYSASVSSFPLLPGSASQWLPQCSSSGFPSYVVPVLSCLVSRAFFPGSKYSAFLFVSFHPSLIRSHSCSSGAWLPLSLLPFSASLPLPFVRFFSASGYLAFCFFLSVLPVSASQRLPRCASPLSLPGSPRFLLPGFPCIPSRFSYSAFCWFLSSFPASLPQLFHRCSPFRSLLRGRCLTSAFFRPLPF